MKILIMAGTRPEAIKIAPVAQALRNKGNIDVVLCNSGQHREMIRQAFDDFRITPDIELDVMVPNQSLAGLTGRLFGVLDSVLEKETPDCLLVQGDTMTVMVGALCAFYRDIKVGHIEAGLRTYKRRSPFPEEINRQVVSRVADFHFVPTKLAADNLLREGVDANSVFLTGNTVIDSLLYMHEQVKNESGLILPDVEKLLTDGKRMILVTGHRRENFGDSFVNICRALSRIAEARPDCFVLYPVHLNPNVQRPVNELLGGRERVLLTAPMAYKQFVAHLGAAHLILTDSGGIQEEAPALNKPVLVMRNDTERPEGMDAGVAKLVGTREEEIVAQALLLLDSEAEYQKMAKSANPYGDGHAAERIMDVLCTVLK